VSDGGWSFGGSILTFVFPVLLFIGVAVYLYILYTKPTIVPGRRTSPVERPVSHTAIPGIPAAKQVGGNLLGRPPVDPAADDGPGGADGENAAPEAQE
jgi:hypothetical protein